MVKQSSNSYLTLPKVSFWVRTLSKIMPERPRWNRKCIQMNPFELAETFAILILIPHIIVVFCSIKSAGGMW